MKTYFSVGAALLLAAGLVACSPRGDGDGGDPPDDGGPDGADGGADGGLVTSCSATPAPCTPEAGTGASVRLRGTIVTPDRVLCDGEVLYSSDSGAIACVDADCSGDPSAAGAAVVCAGGIVFPGLIDAHQHLQFDSLPVWEHPGKKFARRSQWQADAEEDDFEQASKKIRGNSTATCPDCVGNFSCEIEKWAEARLLMAGTTSAVGTLALECIGGMVRDLDSRFGLSGLDGFTAAPVDSEAFLFRVDTAAVRAELDADTLRAFLLHLGEGVDGTSRGEFDDLLDEQLLRPESTIVHGTAVSTAQLQQMATSSTSLVWSPQSNLDLYGLTAPVTVARSLGVSIALGADWTASGSLNLLEELRCADFLNGTYYDHAFSDAELVGMVTTAAARAVGLDDRLGALRAGLVADLAVYDGDRTAPFRALLDARPEDVRLVVVGGRPLFGDPALLAGLEPNAFCEDVDVCGAGRRICVRSAAGPDDPDRFDQTLDGVRTTLEQALAAAATTNANPAVDYAYALSPLFDCSAPPVSPRCRPGTALVSGTPADGDADGDGLADATDLCPRTFDPAIVEAAEADADADGLGDACDPCPLTGDATCAPANPSDGDGDGIPTSADLCPTVADPDQADGDGDGKGDACDACPAFANPGPAGCVTRIGALRDPAAADHPAIGAAVALEGVIVTALKALPSSSAGKGFYVQDPTATRLGGLFVFTGATTPTVAVGNVVELAGTYDEFNGVSELDLTAGSVTVTSAATTLPFGPIVAAPADLATGGALAEELESMLVQVQGVTVIDANPDAGGGDDFDEFAVTGGLRVDDALLDGVSNGQPVAGLGQTFTTITGIQGFSFSDFKLLPRTAADLVTP